MLQSKYFRNIIVNLPIWFGCEYLILYVICRFISKDDALVAAFGALLALYCFRIFNWLINLSSSTLVFYLNRKQLVSDTTAMLYNIDFPILKEMAYMDGSIDILETALNDENTTSKIKIFCAKSLGELNCLRQTNRIIDFMRSQSVLDAAFSRYLSEKNSTRRVA